MKLAWVVWIAAVSTLLVPFGPKASAAPVQGVQVPAERTGQPSGPVRADEAEKATETTGDVRNGIGGTGVAEQPSPPAAKTPPPDGLLPVYELSRLAYTSRDAPKALLYGNHLLIVARSGFVEGHDAATGTFSWKLGLPGEELFDPVVFDAGPLVSGTTDAYTVVLSEPSGHVLLVDGLTGEIQSERRLPFELALPPIRGPGDLVFLATPSGDILAYDVNEREVVFQTATGERPLAIASTDSLVIVSGASQTLTALELPRGSVRWTFRGRAAFHAAAAFGRDATRVYIGDDTGEFYSLDAAAGRVTFRWSTGAAIRNAALVEGERIYLASYANTLFAFNARSGDEHWRANLPGRPATSPMRVSNRLLVATFDGVLIEIDPQRGQPGKSYTAPGEIVVAPSFYLSSPSPEELAARAEAETLELDDVDELDPDLLGPTELDGNVPPDELASTRELEGSEAPPSAFAEGAEPADWAANAEAAETAEPAEPPEPQWFERSRIAMALRSGEVLLLGHKAPQAPPSDETDADGEPGVEDGKETSEEAARLP